MSISAFERINHPLPADAVTIPADARGAYHPPPASPSQRATRPRSVRKALTSLKPGTGRVRKVSHSLADLPAV